MKRSMIITIAVIVLLVAGLGVTIYMWRQDKQSWEAERTTMNQQIANVQARWGTDQIAYTVRTAVKSGDVVKDSDLQEVMIPSVIDSSYYIKDTSSIIGKTYKIAISNPTILTKDMFMDDKITDDMRSFDIHLTSYSTGLHVGDYIDIYFTAPYGDRYLVLSKMKVRKISSSGLITCYMTAAQRHIWTGALIDYYLNSDYGATITGERYIEPGLQQSAVEYYQVPENIYALLTYDPNISTEEIAELTASEKQRTNIEQALAIFRTAADTVESDAGKLQAGRSADTAYITAVTQEEAAAMNTDIDSELWDNTVDAASDAVGDATSGTTDTSTTTDTTDTIGTTDTSGTTDTTATEAAGDQQEVIE